MKEIIINSNEAGQRLDKMLLKYLDKAPKSFLYKMFRKKNITLNDKKCLGNEILKEADSLKLFLSDETITSFKSSDITNFTANKKHVSFVPDIIYEDDNIMLVNKPVGLLSQKSKAEDESINELLINYCFESGRINKDDLRSFNPSVCNRLDRNTSGIITFGKTLSGLQGLSKLLKERSLGKYYRCIVLGEIKEAKRINGYLTKNNNSNMVSISNTPIEDASRIITEYKPIASNGELTVLEVKLITGKSHQIRAHLASIGHPIIGDTKYGNKESNKYSLKHQMLHSYRLEMPSDIDSALNNLSGKVFIAKEPTKFKKISDQISLKL